MDTPSQSLHRSPISLPQELIDTIVDFLHNDTPTLIACSLVASNWLPSTRFHLFGTVCVRGVHEKNGLNVFLKFFRKASPVLSFAIRHLSIASFQARHGSASSPRVSAQVIAFFLRHLPSLKSLKLHNVDLEAEYSESRVRSNMWPARPFELERLDIEDVHVRSVKLPAQHLFEILGLFSRIDTLRIGHVHVYANTVAPTLVMAEQDVIPCLSDTLAVRSLSLQMLPSMDLCLQRLRDRLVLQAPFSLSVSHIWPQLNPMIRSLIVTARGSLSHLSMDGEWVLVNAGAPPDPHEWRTFDLSSCLKLSSFEFHIRMQDSVPVRNGNRWKRAVKVISLLPPSIHTVTFSLSTWGDDGRLALDHPEWGNLNRALAKLRSLQKLRVKWHDIQKPPKLRALMPQIFDARRQIIEENLDGAPIEVEFS